MCIKSIALLLFYKTPSTFSCKIESEISCIAPLNRKKQASTYDFWLFLGSKRYFGGVISALKLYQNSEMTRSSRRDDQKFSREFCEKKPF